MEYNQKDEKKVGEREGEAREECGRRQTPKTLTRHRPLGPTLHACMHSSDIFSYSLLLICTFLKFKTSLTLIKYLDVLEI